jgi:hypothetical protein
MKIDAKAMRRLLVSLLNDLKAADLNLRAHQTLFQFMNAAYPEENLEQKLSDLARSPHLVKEIRDRYDAPLEKLRAYTEQLGEDQGVSKFLQEWIQQTKPN